METDMNERQAQKLAQDIRHEAPHVIVKAVLVQEWGEKIWLVLLLEKNSNKLLLRIEKPSDWEEQKSAFLLY